MQQFTVKLLCKIKTENIKEALHPNIQNVNDDESWNSELLSYETVKWMHKVLCT